MNKAETFKIQKYFIRLLSISWSSFFELVDAIVYAMFILDMVVLPIEEWKLLFKAKWTREGLIKGRGRF